MAQNYSSATMKLVSFTNRPPPQRLHPSCSLGLESAFPDTLPSSSPKTLATLHFLPSTKCHIILPQALEPFFYLEYPIPSSLSGQLPSVDQDLLFLLPVPRKSRSCLWMPAVLYTFLHVVTPCTVRESFLPCLFHCLCSEFLVP